LSVRFFFWAVAKLANSKKAINILFFMLCI
jgi:hypothetical protein